MIDKSKYKGFCFFLEIPLYWFARERSKKLGVSVARYLNWLISLDVEKYLNEKEEKKYD